MTKSEVLTKLQNAMTTVDSYIRQVQAIPGSAKNAADTIVNNLMGGDNDLSKDESWINTLKQLFN